MSTLANAGLPTALALTNPPRRRKRRRKRPIPVSYDKSGKRLRRIIGATGALIVLGAVGVAAIAPAMLAPTRPTAMNGDGEFPRRFIATHDSDVPVIGDVRDPLTRVVKVVHEHAGTGALPGPADLAALEGPGPGGWWITARQPPEQPPLPTAKLVDPISGEFIRNATDEEAAKIGGRTYATEHFGRPPDKTLMLTFDDGPDPTWTPLLLDLLSREHVPATFFVIGENVVEHPELFQRTIREGHLVGNHTMTHIDFDQESDLRNRQEIISTDRVMRATAGYDTRLFRTPYGDPDHNLLGMLQGQQLGQLHVGYDIDTNDWKYKPGQEIPVQKLDGEGYVVLAHDAGGNRAGTVKMVEKLIHEAKAQGYTFTTLAPILPKVDIPQTGVPPSIADRATLLALQAIWVAPYKIKALWFAVGSMLILTAFLSSLTERSRRFYAALAARGRLRKRKPPVFYDKSGKRLRRFVMTVCVLLCVIVGALAWFIPAAVSGVRGIDSDSGFALRELRSKSDMPLVGDGVLTRLVKVVRVHNGTGNPPGAPEPYVGEDGEPLRGDPMPAVQLYDASSGAYIRDAADWEVDEIGDETFVVDAYGTVPDHTMMLTFDDGPDPTWTPEILDVLASEHVPATFFVIGERVAGSPDLVVREVQDGNMVGNHSLTHPKLDEMSGVQRQAELVVTDRIIRAAAHYDTPLFRIPMGDPSGNPLTQLQSQHLGYIQVNESLDSHDWEHAGPHDQVPPLHLDGSGTLVVMHDGGGLSRQNTVTFLRQFIKQAKDLGYTFTTIAPLLPLNMRPHTDIQPSLLDRATLFASRALYVFAENAISAVIMFTFAVVLVYMTFYLVLSVINDWRQRRKVWPELPDEERPFVTVTIAAYNEDKVVARTLDALRASDYPAHRFEVVAVNDGSTDDTLAVLRSYRWSRLRVVSQRNGGKSTALNNAARHADPRSTVIITMDADTLFHPSTISRLARHFVQTPGRANRVGVVSGHVKVGNRRNILTWWQSLEYLSGVSVIRMAEMMAGVIIVVPGACSAWRRDLLEEIGGFSEDTLAEDMDAVMTMQRMRYKVVHDNLAVCDTEAPETLPALLKQRKRWMFGNLQVMWKNRGMLFRPKYGLLGMVAMPITVIQLFLNLLFLPIMVVIGVDVVYEGVKQHTAIGVTILLVMHMIVPVTAVAISRDKWRHLLLVPIHRPIYEMLRLYLVYSCAYRVLKGAVFKWDKLERLNSVTGSVTERSENEEVDVRLPAVAAVSGLRPVGRPVRELDLTY
jgi:peptidoglycan/xylan/chitin deacetylase (PgdA/CDA1 family)/cellulose synthase/poly-beta-1,6-N-acetylglucosamine synthase-like glycosyltransferase